MLSFISVPAEVRPLAIVLIGAFFDAISIGMDFVIIPLLFEHAGLTKTTIGLIMATEMVATLCMAPILPLLSSRIGFLKIMLVAGLLRNGMILLLPLYEGTFYWLPVMFVAGLGGFTLFLSIQLWINSLCNDKRRGLALGALSTVMALGIAIGPLIVTLTGGASFLSFFVSSAICSLAFFPLYAVRRTIPHHATKSSLHVFHIVKKAPLPIIGGMMADGIFFSLTSFLVLYGIYHGLSEQEASLLITAMLLGAILLELPIGWLSDHVDRRLFIHACVLVLFFCSRLLPFAVEHDLLPWLLFCFWAGAQSGLYTSSLAMLAIRFKGADLISANAAFAMMNCLGGMIGVVASGIMMDIWKPEGLTYAISGITLIYVITVAGKHYLERKHT